MLTDALFFMVFEHLLSSFPIMWKWWGCCSALYHDFKV